MLGVAELRWGDNPQKRGGHAMPPSDRGFGSDSASQIEILASAFEVTVTDVRSDARQLLASCCPLDELLVSTCHTHCWAAETGIFYLLKLRSVVDPVPQPWGCP
jgi:hypothetical protein